MLKELTFQQRFHISHEAWKVQYSYQISILNTYGQTTHMHREREREHKDSHQSASSLIMTGSHNLMQRTGTEKGQETVQLILQRCYSGFFPVPAFEASEMLLHPHCFLLHYHFLPASSQNIQLVPMMLSPQPSCHEPMHNRYKHFINQPKKG